MNETLSIFLPLPPDALRPNARVCWQAKMRATKEARRRAFREVLWMLQTKRANEGLDFEQKPVAYSLGWRYWRGVAPDQDNALAACKAYIDGCCDALAVNDRALTCRGITPMKDRAAGVSLTFFFSIGKEDA